MHFWKALEPKQLFINGSVKEMHFIIAELAAIEEGDLMGTVLTASVIGWPRMPISEDFIGYQRSHVESWIYGYLANIKHIWLLVGARADKSWFLEASRSMGWGSRHY